MGQVVPFIQNPEYFFKQGVIAYQKKDWHRATRLLQRAIDLRPSKGFFTVSLAAVLSDMGQYERSNEILLHVVEHIDYQLYDCYYFLANNYAYLGLFDKAREAANNYLKLMPYGEFRADTEELLELLNLEDLDAGIENDELVDHPVPDQVILQYEEAWRYIKEGNYRQAERNLREMIEDQPSYLASYNQLARALHLQGRTEEAIFVLQELIEEQPYVPALCQIALLLFEAGHKEEASYWTERLKDVVPIDKGHMYKVATTLCRLGEYEAAFPVFRYLQKHMPQEKASFFYRYGVVAYHLGYNNRTRKAWSIAKRWGHEHAANLLATWEIRSLDDEEVRCEDLRDLAFGIE
ncbi:LOW QUALITY PROTEIN: hypothetical protein JCM19037_913 [Geomicrobium sp. JCM 19037]|nr:LOW QUALITY PROTEIN: hypothetical protein JCM19037_913 [Geomicrobium sp. JCM 19037]